MLLLFIDVLEDDTVCILIKKIIDKTRLSNNKEPYPADMLAEELCSLTCDFMGKHKDTILRMRHPEDVMGFLYVRVPLVAPEVPAAHKLSSAEALEIFNNGRETASMSTEDGGKTWPSVSDIAYSSKAADDVKAALEDDVDALCNCLWLMAFGSCVFCFKSPNLHATMELLRKVEGKVVPPTEWIHFTSLYRTRRAAEDALRTPFATPGKKRERNSPESAVRQAQSSSPSDRPSPPRSVRRLEPESAPSTPAGIPSVPSVQESLEIEAAKREIKAAKNRTKAKTHREKKGAEKQAEKQAAQSSGALFVPVNPGGRESL